MGSGDWNDGMNRVGQEGKGESVWLAFFMCDVLTRFSGIARMRGDLDFNKQCETEVNRLRQSIEQHAWDGQWYLRAFFDDGTPVGSAKNTECRIDSIAQSWSVLSKVGDPDRSRLAMESVDKYLVRRYDALIQLLDPPFNTPNDKSNPNPGYIKGYVPGVRENGGQYTHGAIWLASALLHEGRTEEGYALLHALLPRGGEYAAEPFVLAADVWTNPDRYGEAGWSWYTGSAGWYFRTVTEDLLGLRLEDGKLTASPRLPENWGGFEAIWTDGNGQEHAINIGRNSENAGDSEIHK